MSLYYLVVGTLACAINLVMATLLLIRGRQQAFPLMILLYVLSVWLSMPLVVTLVPPDKQFIATKYVYLFASAVPVCIVAFGLNMMEVPLNHISLKISGTLSVIFIILMLTSNNFVTGLRLGPGIPLTGIPGSFFSLFMVYFACPPLYALYTVYHAYRREPDPAKKNRLKWVIFSFILANMSGLIHFIGTYTGKEPILPDIPIIAFALLLGYAIIKQRLYDMELLSRDAVIRLGIAFLIGVPLLLGRFLIPLWHQKQADGPWPFAEFVGAIIGIMLITLALRPGFLKQLSTGPKLTLVSRGRILSIVIIPYLVGVLLSGGAVVQVFTIIGLIFLVPSLLPEIRMSVQTGVDQYLFHEKYSYLEQIHRIADDMFRYTNIPDLLKHLVNDLSAGAHLVWAGVWLYDLAEGKFALRQASDSHLSGSSAALAKEDDVLLWLEREHRLVISGELASNLSDGDTSSTLFSLEQKAASKLQSLNIAAAYPVFIDKKLIGFIGFGPKTDNTMFHQADYDSLTELGSKAEHAIGQAYMLYEQSLMLSKLAHDTLNALHALGMVLSFLNAEMGGPMTPIQKRQLEIALTQRQFIEDCLTDLRELERLVMLRMQGAWRMDVYEITDVAQEAVEAFQTRAQTKGVLLEGQWTVVSPALGDQRAVRRVVDNLIVNALKFTPKGGRVRVSVKPTGDNISIAVVDTGPGIPPNELPRVFDPFYQGPSGMALAKGTGLGLSVVKEVAALHKGAVFVESVVGVGTTFRVDFPSIKRQKEFNNSPQAASDHPQAA